jgi:hypothetical protein
LLLLLLQQQQQQQQQQHTVLLGASDTLLWKCGVLNVYTQDLFTFSCLADNLIQSDFHVRLRTIQEKNDKYWSKYK